MKLRIGTRGSALARAQASDVARRLEAAGHATETVIVATLGDRVTDRAFTDVGTFGIFVREIEAELLAGRIDVAVHSYKDLPSQSPPELVVAAVPERLDPADVLLVRTGSSDAIEMIPVSHGATVGTSAVRRQALLRSLRPDLVVRMLRGNVPTRVRALSDGKFDAVVLAAAGLMRLERAAGADRLTIPPGVIRTRLDPSEFVPAPSQGAIALQVRADASAVHDAVSALDFPAAARTLLAERTALALAEGGCTLPFGAWCTMESDGGLLLRAALALDDGTIIRAAVRGDDPMAIAAQAWRDLSAALPA